MNTRMEKYDDMLDSNMSRTKRNQNIYNSTDMTELSRFKSNTNVSVISDAPKEINIEKIKNYLESLESGKDEKRRRLDVNLPEEKEVVVERTELRNYDINSILEEAREKKEVDYEDERHRKINNTQYDILKSIKIEDEEIENIDEELNTGEKTIVDLIQDIQKNSKVEKDEDEDDVDDLFKELMSDDENTVVMSPINDDEMNNIKMKETLLDITSDLEKIKEPVNDATQELLLEKEKLKQRKSEEKSAEKRESKKLNSVDKSFYTNSMSFSKNDFEDFEELEKSTTKFSFVKLAIIISIVFLIVTILLILNYLLDWNII